MVSGCLDAPAATPASTCTTLHPPTFIKFSARDRGEGIGGVPRRVIVGHLDPAQALHSGTFTQLVDMSYLLTLKNVKVGDMCRLSRWSLLPGKQDSGKKAVFFILRGSWHNSIDATRRLCIPPLRNTNQWQCRQRVE